MWYVCMYVCMYVCNNMYVSVLYLYNTMRIVGVCGYISVLYIHIRSCTIQYKYVQCMYILYIAYKCQENYGGEGM